MNTFLPVCTEFLFIPFLHIRFATQIFKNIFEYIPLGGKKYKIAFRYLSDLYQHLQDKVLHSRTPKKSGIEDVGAKSFQECKDEATLKLS